MSLDELELLARAKEGSDSCLAALLNLHGDRLKHYAGRYLLGAPRDKSESDAFQDTQILMMKCFREGAFKGTTIEEFRAYAYTTIRNLCINWVRSNRQNKEPPGLTAERILDDWRRLVTFPSIDQESPSEAAARSEEDDILDAAVRSLRPIHQQIYQLALQPGITNEEIGQQIGRSAEAVRKTRERILIFLHRRIRQMIQGKRSTEESSMNS